MKLDSSKFNLKPDPGNAEQSTITVTTINIPTHTTPSLPQTLCIPSIFTNTTATLTPTTLKNIEQAFQEITNTENESVPFQAGFVPPPTALSYQSSISADVGSEHDFSMDSSSMMSNSSDNGGDMTTSPGPAVIESGVGQESEGEVPKTGRGSNKKAGKATARKNKGGRRPNKSSNLTPEEEEKRRIRRERNKMAAARCRRRREDRTKELQQETDSLESKKRALQTEIEELEREKDDLEFLLESHKNNCKRLAKQQQPTSILHIKPDPEIANTLLSLAESRIKQEPVEVAPTPPPVIKTIETTDNAMESSQDDASSSPKHKILLTSAAIDPLPTITITKQDTMISVANVPKMNRPNRPNTLNVPILGASNTNNSAASNSSSSQALNSIPIQTPSNGIFNFESLMEGGTGLTPVQPKIMGDKTPLDLITPTNDTKMI